MGRAFDSDSAEKPPFILQKFYDRTVAINGQSVSRIAGAYEETEIYPQPTGPNRKIGHWTSSVLKRDIPAS
jgi:hypothetical protein